MPEPPRRKRFQIHLSTAMVMMFVAGVLIWANVYGRRLASPGLVFNGTGPTPRSLAMTDTEFIASKKFEHWSGNLLDEHGWPYNALQTRTCGWISRVPVVGVASQARNASLWRTSPIVYNALIALAILFAVWFLCEWLIRRRRRPTSSAR